MTVIEKVLGEPWPPSVEIGREVPEASADENCVVRLIPTVSCYLVDTLE